MRTCRRKFRVDDIGRRHVPGPPRKEDAECCQAKRDELGRLPVGWCGPDCIRRPAPFGKGTE